MPRVAVHLSTSRRWSTVEGASLSGQAFRDTTFLGREALAQYVARSTNDGTLEVLLSNLNGFFAVILDAGHSVYAAVDHVRSIPLFYALAGGRLYLSDDATWVAASLGVSTRDRLATAEFLLTGYVTGSDTLDPRIKQLQAGEMLVATISSANISITTRRYFEFCRTEALMVPAEQLERKLAASFEESIERLITVANGRQLVIPLSGGYDSRLIATQVKRSGYDHVLTFTYGRPGNSEVRISQEVAKTLGFEWTFVPYGPEEWRAWFIAPERAEYFGMAHGLTSVPHIQDWPAVWSLKEQGRLDDNALFVPGHTGDFISGGHTLTGFNADEVYSSAQYAEAVMRTHYWLWRPNHVLDDPEALHERIWARSTSDAPADLNGLKAIALHDRWDWQERQAKFIVNSLRVYDYWGYDWWMPMWDMEFVRFWQAVPLALRQERRLYVEYVGKSFGEVADLDPHKARQTDRDTLSARLIAGIKASPLLPRKLLKQIWNRSFLTSPYRNHPMAWFALVPPDRFAATYDGNQSINSLLAAFLVYGDWQAPERSPEA